MLRHFSLNAVLFFFKIYPDMFQRYNRIVKLTNLVLSFQLFQPFISCHQPAVSTVFMFFQSRTRVFVPCPSCRKRSGLSSLRQVAGSILTIKETGTQLSTFSSYIGLPISGVPTGTSQACSLLHRWSRGSSEDSVRS